MGEIAYPGSFKAGAGPVGIPALKVPGQGHEE